LNTLDWGQSVTISAASIRRVKRFRHVVEGILWTLSHILYFVAAIFLAMAALVLRRRAQKRSAGDNSKSVLPRPGDRGQFRQSSAKPVITLSLLGPFGLRIDFIGQMVLVAIAILLLVLLARSLLEGVSSAVDTSLGRT
jgi:hypothetical protein